MKFESEIIAMTAALLGGGAGGDPGVCGSTTSVGRPKPNDCRLAHVSCLCSCVWTGARIACFVAYAVVCCRDGFADMPTTAKYSVRCILNIAHKHFRMQTFTLIRNPNTNSYRAAQRASSSPSRHTEITTGTSKWPKKRHLLPACLPACLLPLLFLIAGTLSVVYSSEDGKFGAQRET